MSHSPQAAISIPANIADGFEKKRNLDKARFYNIAHGLIEECRYYLISAGGSRLWRYKTLKRNLGEVSRLLEAYARRVTRP
jgi:four helix bundle protein